MQILISDLCKLYNDEELEEIKFTYKDYSVMKSVNRDDTDTTMYMGYADGYVRYSNDGIAYYNKKGTAIWNQTYTMQKPQACPV